MPGLGNQDSCQDMLIRVGQSGFNGVTMKTSSAVLSQSSHPMIRPSSTERLGVGVIATMAAPLG